MLELRPTGENCNKPLPPTCHTDAMTAAVTETCPSPVHSLLRIPMPGWQEVFLHPR